MGKYALPKLGRAKLRLSASAAKPLLPFLALFVAALLVVQFDWMAPLNRSWLDRSFAFNRQWFPQPVRNDPVIVGINEAFLDSIEEPLALSHAYLNQFLTAMSQAGPQVLAMDIVLPERRFDSLVSIKHPDVDFHKTLLQGLLNAIRHTTLIAAKVWDHDRGHFREIQVDYAAVLDMQDPSTRGQASALFCPDADGRIRWYPGPSCQLDGSPWTISSEVSKAMGSRADWRGLINYQIGSEFTYIPIQEVLKLAQQNDVARLRTLFAGRAVLLGVALDDIDLLELPVPLAEWRPGNHRVPGMLAHAQIIRSMLNQGLIQPVSNALLVLACALFALFWFQRSVVQRLALFLLALVVLLGSSVLLLWYGYWLPPGAMLLIGTLAVGSRSALDGWQHFRDKQRLNRTFSGYVSPEVMREIVSGSLTSTHKGTKRRVCILFSDIRGFTSRSEHLPAEQVVSLLNRYFAAMTAVIHRHGGTVDKFIGDGLMAFFGAPNLLACPEKNALEAASDMLMALAELNVALASEGVEPIVIGIGIHSGEAVIGHIGSPERHEYTAIGDTVNTSSRLEGLCKTLGHTVLCSVSVADAVGYPPSLMRLGPQALKGRADIDVFAWQPAVVAQHG